MPSTIIIVLLIAMLLIAMWLYLTDEPANTLVLHHDNKMTTDRVLAEIEAQLWMFKYYTISHFGKQTSIIGHNKKPDASNYYRAWEDYERLAYDVCSKAGWL